MNLTNYISTGKLKDFPKEVIKEMLVNQVNQGNKEDVTVFERQPTIYYIAGGFDWNRTPEGEDFWCNVIVNKDFKLFFSVFNTVPEYWCIRSNKKAKEYFFFKYGVKDIFKWGWSYIGYDGCSSNNGINGANYPNSFLNNCKEVSYELFMNLIYPNLKIIGYISPIDLFGKIISKGTVYVKHDSYYNTYYPEFSSSNMYSLPAEIVENWDPICETYSLPMIDCYRGKQHGDKIIYGSKSFNISTIKDLINNGVTEIEFNGIPVTMGQIEKIKEYLEHNEGR